MPTFVPVRRLQITARQTSNKDRQISGLNHTLKALQGTSVSPPPVGATPKEAAHVGPG